MAIVDFKSTDRAQAEEVTRDQLHVYAVGYEELTGEDARRSTESSAHFAKRAPESKG